MTSIAPVGGAGIALGEDLEALVERLRGSVVAVSDDTRSARGVRRGGGAGTAWADDLVVTNAHVVRGERALVEAADGGGAMARVVRRDDERDLAALNVDGLDLPRVVVRLEPLRAGELLVAVGHPWGSRGNATLGIATRSFEAEDHAVTTDAALAPGNSGGPLADASGRVVGINARVAGGLGFAIPSATVEAFLADEALSGPPARLGVVGLVVPVDAAVEADVSEGLLLTEVPEGTPAAVAGLIPGDILLRVNGSGGDGRALGAALRTMRAGAEVRVDLLRGGRVRSIGAVAAAA